MGLACIGLPIWTSWETLTETPKTPPLDQEPELVYLITILFSGVVIVIASISGIFVGFLPSSGSSSRVSGSRGLIELWTTLRSPSLFSKIVETFMPLEA